MSKIVQIDGKFYDFGTKNSSFLLTAQELKTLGIKNWYFMLEVRYPHLGVQDIDPHNPDISAEDIGKIHIECVNNVWFWLRECAVIPVRGAPKPYPVELTRASCAATWCYTHNIDFILCQPRQTWKTTIVLLLITYTFIYRLKNATIPLMHLTEKKVMENASDLKNYIEALPPYMNPFSNKKKVGIKSMKYDEHNTSITLLSSSDSDVVANDKLRGTTLFLLFIDEWEYIPFIDYVIAGGTPAIISGRIIAKQNNGVACMMYASTPGNLETPQGKAAQKIIDATPPWSEQYYDFTDEEIEQSFEGVESVNEDGVAEQITMLYIEYNYKQLRRDEKWLRAQYMEAARLGKIDEYRRGCLLQRYRGSGAVLFDQEDIDYIINNQKQPDYDIFVLKKYHLYVYKHKINSVDLTSDTPYFDINIPYLIGMDISTGGGGDNTTICVVHPYTLEVVAELSSPYMGSIDQMRVITFVAKLIPKGIFCLETNNIGKALVDFVQETELEDRFYHDPRLDISKNATIRDKDDVSILKRRSKEKGYIGTYVTASVRKNMFDLLLRNVKDFKHLLLTKYLVKDITNLVRVKGKIQADVGEHDDMVMGYLHAVYVLTYGHDLTRFGIDKRLCSFEKIYDVIKEYESDIEDSIVDNMIPYETPTVYEEQLLHDLTSNYSGTRPTVNGYDDYGYRNDQYVSSTLQNTSQEHSLTRADMAFFNEVNSFY